MGPLSINICFDRSVVHSCYFNVHECDLSVFFFLHCERNAFCGVVDGVEQVSDVMSFSDGHYVVNVTVPEFYVFVVREGLPF